MKMMVLIERKEEIDKDDVYSLASKFAYVSFSYVRRTGNYVAHFLAQFALQRKEKFFLLEVVPQGCTDCLLKDSPSSVYYSPVLFSKKKKRLDHVLTRSIASDFTFCAIST